MRILKRCAALSLVLMACCAATRPYTLDDLLSLETYRGLVLDPSERWLIIDTDRPYETAGRYDYLQGPHPALGRPMLVNLERPGQALPLLPAVSGMGYSLGPFSPDGARVAVYRHQDTLWELGVVTLADRSVRWLGVVGDQPLWGTGLQWRSNTELVALGLSPGDLPADLRRGRQAKARLQAAWAKTAHGAEPAYTRIGSGRYAGVRAPSPPRSLLRIDVASGAVISLGQGQFKDIEISPGGRFVAVIEAGAPAQPNPASPPRMVDFEGRRTNLVIADLTSGAITRPTEREVLPNLLSWSADERLLIYTRPDGADWSAGNLVEVTANTSHLRDLTTDRLRAQVITPSRALGFSVVHAGWLGRTPIVLGQARMDGRSDWYALSSAEPSNLTAGLAISPGPQAAVSGDALYVQTGPEVWRIKAGRSDRIGKAARLVSTARTDAGERGRLVELGAAAAWIEVGGAGLRRIQRLGDASSLSLAPLVANERQLALSRHGAVVSATDAHGVQTLAVEKQERSVTVLTLNHKLSDVALPDVQPLKHPGSDGHQLTSWLYTPPGLKPGERAPLVVLTYPNVDQPNPPRAGLPSSGSPMLNTNLFTAAGYAVLDASFQRSPSSHEPGEGFTQALLDATDAAVATGKIDPNRVALAGHSFGGYATQFAATKTGRFKALIASMGVSDLASMMMTSVPHYRSVPEDGLPAAVLFSWGEAGQANLGAAPWEDPERYVRNSPVYQAGAITTPMLLIGSDQEWGPIGQQEEMFNALWRQGKDAELLTFWGESHVLQSPANIRAYWAEVFAFLEPLIGPPVASDDDTVSSRASQTRTQASMASRSSTSP